MFNWRAFSRIAFQIHIIQNKKFSANNIKAYLIVPRVSCRKQMWYCKRYDNKATKYLPTYFFISNWRTRVYAALPRRTAQLDTHQRRGLGSPYQ